MRMYLFISLLLQPVDVVQSIRPSLGTLSSRGVAVVGVASRLVSCSTNTSVDQPSEAPISSAPVLLIINRTRSIFSKNE